MERLTVAPSAASVKWMDRCPQNCRPDHVVAIGCCYDGLHVCCDRFWIIEAKINGIGIHNRICMSRRNTRSCTRITWILNVS